MCPYTARCAYFNKKEILFVNIACKPQCVHKKCPFFWIKIVALAVWGQFFSVNIYIHTGRDRLMWRLLAPPPQTPTSGGPIFKNFFLLERYWKNLWDGMSNFLIFLILKAVGPKRVFQCFLRLCRKNCPIFTFDMSLERYWTVDFRIFENFEKSWKLSILEKK